MIFSIYFSITYVMLRFRIDSIKFTWWCIWTYFKCTFSNLFPLSTHYKHLNNRIDRGSIRITHTDWHGLPWQCKHSLYVT